MRSHPDGDTVMFALDPARDEVVAIRDKPGGRTGPGRQHGLALVLGQWRKQVRHLLEGAGNQDQPLVDGALLEDRKSTRLNSSHVKISYAVFCLKKKKTKQEPPP